MEDPKLPEVDEEPLDPEDDVEADDEFGEPDEMQGEDEGDSGTADVPQGEDQLDAPPPGAVA